MSTPTSKQILADATEAVQIFADAARFQDADTQQREEIWADATRDIMRILIHRIAASRGLPAPELPVRRDPDPMTAGCKTLMQIEDVTDWSALELGPVYEHLLTQRPGKTRGIQGSYFTPQPVAQAVSRLALDLQLDRFALSDEPLDMLQVLAVDPACGAGVFLIEAARHIGRRLALRLYGEAPPGAVRSVMPAVLTECVFGIDIDPIAVEITRSVLWIEADGLMPWGALDWNVICGNALELNQPPKLIERMGGLGAYKSLRDQWLTADAAALADNELAA